MNGVSDSLDIVSTYVIYGLFGIASIIILGLLGLLVYHMWQRIKIINGW